MTRTGASTADGHVPAGLSDDELREVVELATLAPSVHNTQPWRFTWDGRALSVHEDPSRGLPVLDPSGRERLLSCGAAVLHARLALAECGLQVAVSTGPEPDDPHLVARLTVAGRHPGGDDVRALVDAVRRRATARDVFDAAPLPEDVRTRLADAAAAEGAWTRFVDDGGTDAVALQVLLAGADRSQRSDPAYLEELAWWRRDDGAEGVPSSALPPLPVHERGSSWVMRDFTARAAEPAPHSHGPADPPTPEHPTVLVLGTSGDEREDWVTAGQALGRVLLQGTLDGVAAQPLTQVLEFPALRGRMRLALGVVGHPQMLLRLGLGTTARTTRRRAVEDVLDVTPPTAPVRRDPGGRG